MQGLGKSRGLRLAVSSQVFQDSQPGIRGEDTGDPNDDLVHGVLPIIISDFRKSEMILW
jgi:hypothetical protein